MDRRNSISKFHPGCQILMSEASALKDRELCAIQEQLSKSKDVEIHVELDNEDRSNALSLRRNQDPLKYMKKFVELVGFIKSMPSHILGLDPARIRFFQNHELYHSDFDVLMPKRKTSSRASFRRKTRLNTPAPRIGAFEITLRWRGGGFLSQWHHAILYSKLFERRWPNYYKLLMQIATIMSPTPSIMISCQVCEMEDWSTVSQKQDLVNTFLGEISLTGCVPDVQKLPSCEMEQWDTAQQKQDVINTFIDGISRLQLINAMLPFDPILEDWSSTQQTKDLVNTFHDAAQDYSWRRIGDMRTLLQPGAADDWEVEQQAGDLVSVFQDAQGRQAMVQVRLELSHSQVASGMYDMQNPKVKALAAATAILYVGGTCDAGGACSGYASSKKISMEPGYVNQSKSAIATSTHVSASALKAVGHCWLVITSEDTFSKAVRLGPQTQNEVHRVSMVERMRVSGMRVILTWGDSQDLDFWVIAVDSPTPAPSAAQQSIADGWAWGASPQSRSSSTLSFSNLGQTLWGGVSLDIDARSGWGPETITFLPTSEARIYEILVDAYSPQMFGSGAKDVAVEVYDQHGLVARETLPNHEAAWNAKKWHVGTVTKVERKGAGHKSDFQYKTRRVLTQS